jgi:uncharacterized protein (DUF433 family)
MTWDECEVVERVAGKMSGEPVIKGTRVLADTIISNFESGSSLDEIEANYPHVPEEAIRKVIAFYESHQLVP